FSLLPPPPPPTHTLSLHDALPISRPRRAAQAGRARLRLRASAPRDGADRRHAPPSRAQHLRGARARGARVPPGGSVGRSSRVARSEEHTSELQSRFDLVCRLLLEK